MLRNDVGIFTEKGGTIAYYISKKNIAVVDAEFPEQSKHLIDALQKDPGKPFEILINTHHHGDHTAGNISFKGIVPPCSCTYQFIAESAKSCQRKK